MPTKRESAPERRRDLVAILLRTNPARRKHLINGGGYG